MTCPRCEAAARRADGSDLVAAARDTRDVSVLRELVREAEEQREITASLLLEHEQEVA